MKDTLKYTHVLLFLVCVFTSQTFSKYLPEASAKIKSVLDTIDELHQEQRNGQSANHALEQRDTRKSYDTMSDVTHTNHNIYYASGLDSENGQRKKRELSDWLIAPNTRWCGRGNLANGTYNVLGGANAADKCCRKHDHCQLYIPAMSSRYELFNYRPYTLSHCNCDRRFRTCLKMANDEDAKTIGKLFFNMVQTQCFILKTEKVCQQRAEDGTCEHEYVKQKAYLKNNRKF